ncbi:hypothetical protein BDW42DRAFT_175568 [Aspergillus taichungensis]|uniref:Uncharacterized protein n=1 Tax=Aspergillus taichungensis TaxID=482145 RepID=A0A2J5HLP5_9EURO|nr:hypothetical protein BDW42DRAFT_175568 [Aspergillus taichungensis]
MNQHQTNQLLPRVRVSETHGKEQTEAVLTWQSPARSAPEGNQSPISAEPDPKVDDHRVVLR